MKELRLISTNCYNIPERVRELDDDYRLYYNVRRNVIELHNLRHNPTFQLVLPYSQLDTRTIEYIRRTRVDKIINEIKEIDEYNNNLENKLINQTLDEIHEKTKSVINYMNRGGSQIPSYSELWGDNMKVEDVLTEVLIRLGDRDKYDIMNLPQDDEEINTIVKCINMVISEIASDYLPVEFEEEVEVINGVIPYDNLSKKLINLKNVTKNSTKIDTKMYPNELLVKADGMVRVQYMYMPNAVKLGDIISLSPKITLMLIVYGVLGEYCLLQGRYEDSSLYDKRYREMLKIACRVTKEIKLKHGWWN